MRFASLLGQSSRPRGHGDELVYESVQLVGHPHRHQRRRLLLDGLERLQRLGVLVRKVGEGFAGFIGALVVGHAVISLRISGHAEVARSRGYAVSKYLPTARPRKPRDRETALLRSQ